MDKLRASKQSMLGKKIIFLCRMSVFEGNAEVTSKLFKKETKTFTALSEKAQKKKKP